MNCFSDEKHKRGKKDIKEYKNEKSVLGITKPGKYYFPGKITSGCFDGNGPVGEPSKQERIEEIYDYSVEREYDPNGMYTGRPEDEFDKPVQDADDL